MEELFGKTLFVLATAGLSTSVLMGLVLQLGTLVVRRLKQGGSRS